MSRIQNRKTFMAGKPSDRKGIPWQNMTRPFSGSDKTGTYTAQLGVKGAAVMMGMKIKF